MIPKLYFWNSEVQFFQRIESRVSKRYLSTPVHSSVIHDIENMDAAQVSIQGWMDEHNVVYTHDGTLFSLKTEVNSDTRIRHWWTFIQYAQWNFRHKETNKYYQISPIWPPRAVKIIETGSGLVVAGQGRERRERKSYCRMGMGLQFGKMKTSWDGWWRWL